MLKTESGCVIIDCGEKGDGSKVVSHLSQNGISEADYLVVTHFDKDHVGGFSEIVEDITADNILVPNYEGNNKAYQEYLDTAANNSLEISVLKKNISFTLDDISNIYFDTAGDYLIRTSLSELDIKRKNFSKSGTEYKNAVS